MLGSQCCAVNGKLLDHNHIISNGGRFYLQQNLAEVDGIFCRVARRIFHADALDLAAPIRQFNRDPINRDRCFSDIDTHAFYGHFNQRIQIFEADKDGDGKYGGQGNHNTDDNFYGFHRAVPCGGSGGIVVQR